MSHSDEQLEGYWDVVWKQFRKNRTAYIALWLLLPVVLIAVFAPLLASNKPLVFYDGNKVIYPWFNDLFVKAEDRTVIDPVFNAALVVFLPWLVLAVALNGYLQLHGWPGRNRLGVVLVGYLALTVVVAVVATRPSIRPLDTYAARSFSQEELQARRAAEISGEAPTKHGLYVLIPFGPSEQDPNSYFKPPMYRQPPEQWREQNDGFLHVLGTDSIGRDVLTQMIFGTRISLTVGLVAVSIYATIGVIVGALAGYFGGWIDSLLSRLMEVIMLFPSLFLILTLVALIGPSVYVVMVVIGLTSWPGIARLVRGEVLKQRAIDYTLAARALGAPELRIVFRHILPNSLGPVMVAVPFGIASAITTEATLTLLGYGVRPPVQTWGTLLNQVIQNYNYWWLIVVPSVAIFFTLSVFNLVGSGLRDAMDPRLRR